MADRMRVKTDPRVARTRRLIEGAFREVLEEKGFEDLSVQDVADRAGINRVTFYAHFVDRYALLRHAVRKAFEEEVAGKGLAERSLDAESVKALLLAVCGYVAGLHEHCKPPHDHLDWIVGEVIPESCAGLLLRWAGTDGQTGRKGQRGVARNRKAEAATAAGSSMCALAARWSRTRRRGPAAAFVESSLPIVTGILGIK